MCGHYAELPTTRTQRSSRAIAASVKVRRVLLDGVVEVITARLRVELMDVATITREKSVEVWKVSSVVTPLSRYRAVLRAVPSTYCGAMYAMRAKAYFLFG